MRSVIEKEIELIWFRILEQSVLVFKCINLGLHRGVEVEVVTTERRFIDLEHGPTTPDTVPTQLTLLHTVKPGSCTSVCSYQGISYVGIFTGRVDVIDKNNQLSKGFLTFSDPVHSVAIFDEKLFTLVNSKPYKVTVHDLSGKLLTSWTHFEIEHHYSKLAVVSDQVVIPDRENKKLTVYSLTGEVIKHIQCHLLSPNWVSMCAVDNLSVVVSEYETSKVFKMNIPSGEVKWTSQDVPNPEGVTYHGGRVFVTNCSNTTRVWILDVNTG